MNGQQVMFLQFGGLCFLLGALFASVLWSEFSKYPHVKLPRIRRKRKTVPTIEAIAAQQAAQARTRAKRAMRDRC